MHSARGEQTPIEEMIEWLRECLPQSWVFHASTMKANKAGFPLDRKRTRVMDMAMVWSSSSSSSSGPSRLMGMAWNQGKKNERKILPCC
eukprot:5214328-Pyramimonas_sp.AAC.1